jgi:DNA-binding winged helix-turn-helix (wHTH) protein
VRIGLLGTLAVQDGGGRPVRIGGHRVRLLLIMLALDAGKVVPAYSLIERLWEEEPPANSGNALQSLVSRLRTVLRQAGLGDQVVESHPAGYRLAVAPDQVDAVAFEALARQGSQALAAGDPAGAPPGPRRVAWPGARGRFGSTVRDRARRPAGGAAGPRHAGPDRGWPGPGRERQPDR